MALHTALPVYKLAYDLLSLATDLVRNMPRDFKASLGGRLMSDVVNEIRSYNSTDAGRVGWGNWGTAASRVPALASTRFPAGATLSIRGGRTVAVPEAIATAASLMSAIRTVAPSCAKRME
jgi:hypothetical protein